MATVRAYNYRFCPVHNATELFRDLQCLECERESGVTHQPVTKPAPTAPRRQPLPRGRRASTQLTASELRVASLLATGLSQKEIAQRLGYHHSSVSNAVRRACRRIGVISDFDLVRHIRQGRRG